MRSSSHSSDSPGLVLAKWWRRFDVDERPDERSLRMRLERMARIEQDVQLLEALRVWEAWREMDKLRSPSTPEHE
jgi:hypothetical protein